MASVSKNMTPLRRVRSSFLPRLGNVAGLAQLRPELEILTAKIQKKKTSQMLVSKFPSNHHNLDGLDFSRYKKNTWPFYGYLSHQSKSNSIVFFPKIWTPTQKKSESTSNKKACFWYSSILLKLVGQSRRMHTLTFFVHRGLGQVFGSMGFAVGFWCPRNVWKLVCNKATKKTDPGWHLTKGSLHVCDTSLIYLNLFWNWSLRQ